MSSAEAQSPNSIFCLSLGLNPKIITELKTLGKEFVHAALALWNVAADHKLSVNPHIINGIKLCRHVSCWQHHPSQTGKPTFML